MRAFINKLHEILDKAYVTNWLGVVLFCVLLLRIPSFFEPYYYGDEMIYMSLGQGVRQGEVLYKDVYDNKTPLLYLTAALSGNLFWFKAILAAWSIVTIVIFWNLARILFEKNEKMQKIATVIFAILTTIPLLEGNTVNAELFMIGPTMLALFLLLGDGINPKKIFLAGTLFGIGALFKIPAAFDLPVVIAYWVIIKGFSSWKQILKDSIILLLGFITPIALTFVWYFTRGALPEYVKAAFLQNVGYVSSWRPEDVQKPFLVKNAPLLIRAFIVFAGSLILLVMRKKLSKKFILFSVWILFTLFAVTLSERPYPHYLIQAAAPIALLLGMLFAEDSFEQSLSVLPLALALFVPYYFKFYSYPTGAYYAKFLSFAAGKTDKDTYLNSFSPNVKRNYQLADFIIKSAPPQEKVFMWDNDSPTVYALSRRLPPVKYVADYHVLDYSSKSDLAKELANTKPKFIILTQNHPFPEINGLLSQNYLLIQHIENADIWSRIDLAPSR